ncbi:MAG: hypothetical protein K8H99_04305 [Nitrospirae bacterium]|nr:hypothetical protein [Fimbriimonadaceae bacterium]
MGIQLDLNNFLRHVLSGLMHVVCLGWVCPVQLRTLLQRAETSLNAPELFGSAIAMTVVLAGSLTYALYRSLVFPILVVLYQWLGLGNAIDFLAKKLDATNENKSEDVAKRCQYPWGRAKLCFSPMRCLAVQRLGVELLQAFKMWDAGIVRFSSEVHFLHISSMTALIYGFIYCNLALIALGFACLLSGMLQYARLQHVVAIRFSWAFAQIPGNENGVGASHPSVRPSRYLANVDVERLGRFGDQKLGKDGEGSSTDRPSVKDNGR